MAIDHATRVALLELHARYAFTIDDGDAEGWADCFTPDGLLETSRPLTVRGRDELVAFAVDRAAGAQGPARHVTWHETFVELDDGDVVGRCSAAILETTAEGARLVLTATYVDRFTQGQAGWLLRHRAVSIDRVPVPD